MNRQHALHNYLRDLVKQYDAVLKERALLLDPAARLAELNVLRQDLIADAQEALNKYNAMAGTNYTLQQIRDQLNPPAPRQLTNPTP